MRRTALATAALLLVVAPSSAQTPAGSEFRVNTTTTGIQHSPRAAITEDGFVVTWSSDAGGSGNYDVFGQRLDRRGTKIGGEFAVNTFTTDRQWFSDVAALPGGRFVVAWDGGPNDGFYTGVGLRVFERTGTPATPELVANTYTTGTQAGVSVAAAPSGAFVVVWNSHGQDGSSWGVFGQRFDPLGARIGPEFRVNSNTAATQFSYYGGAVAMDDTGRFVVVWAGDGHVHGQRLAPDASPLGAEFQVDVSPGSHALPAVDMTPGGDFVVVWTSGSPAVRARRYAADGTPVGGEMQVSTSPVTPSTRATVITDAAGNATFTWTVGSPSPTALLRRFFADGTPRGPETPVTTNASRPDLESDAVGNVFATWGVGFPDVDIWARRFGGLAPAALVVDTAGNGVWEPGETVDARPSWRNENGAALTFSGAFSSVTGPAGATYATTDAAGDYGTVADAATAACADCYGISVSAPAVRPATHWDASVLETITPDALGQAQPWSLHIGDSFSDVPRANPFYRFVETLLHHHVTGGCTATDYCPIADTARGQMAVFALVAREGPSYAPPACGLPVFDDVPPSSPFCPWIEELARRGVVAGCGGGAFCPDAPVSREQMPVFVLRTLDAALVPPPCGVPVFSDVPASSPFCPWIEELARRGVVTGCGAGNYCPAASVTREQMGVFIAATFGLALYGP